MKQTAYLGTLIYCLSMVAQAPVPCRSALSLDDVAGLLENEVSPNRVRQFVTSCGVSFALTAEAERRIRDVRGTDALIAAIREKAPAPVTPKPTVPKSTAVKTRTNDKDGQVYVWIEPGIFMMGCSGDTPCDSDEKTAHEVEITKGFWLGQTEVTVGAWKRYAKATGKQMPPTPSFNANWKDSTQPIVNIGWNDAEAFCKWVGGRLPSEAEWEYAARADTTQSLYGEAGQIAWYDANSGNRAHPVAGKQANAWGLHDTAGNVWEWVNDWYDSKYYDSSPRRDPQGPARGDYHIMRGGSWEYDSNPLSVSDRVWKESRSIVNRLGCRCAWN